MKKHRTYGFKAHCEIAKMMADYYHSHTGDAKPAGLHHLGAAIREATKAYWRELKGSHILQVDITSAAVAQGEQSAENDHAVPIAHIIDLVLKSTAVTSAQIEELVSMYMPCLVRVTKSEHARLPKVMPTGWMPDACPFARYHEAGIELVFADGLSKFPRCTCGGA